MVYFAHVFAASQQKVSTAIGLCKQNLNLN